MEAKKRDLLINHFSHPHPLELNEQGNEDARCSACTEPTKGPAYCCNLCGFYLHKSCAELPPEILHPLHPQHNLTLLPKSPYPHGKYRCGRCEEVRKGFVYHCFDCEFDIDINCASDPEFTSKIDIPRGVKSIDKEAESEGKDSKLMRFSKSVLEIGKFDHDPDKKSKLEDFLLEKPVREYLQGKNRKVDPVQGMMSSTRDSKEEDLTSKEEKRYQKTTGKHDRVPGTQSKVLKAFKDKDIVMKEKRQQGETGKSSYSSPCCIFRTPFPQLKFQKPELVSIGPYHRDIDHPLDKYKHSFLKKLLSRTSNYPERDLSFYVGEILALENQARACYSDDLGMSSHDFVKMMLLDGCFIIELLRQFGGTREDDLFAEDPINIIMPWQIPVLVQDLLLVENQIPFFVLLKLFDLSKNIEGKPETSVTTMALKFFYLAFPQSPDFISEDRLLEPNHLLDLFVKTLLPSNPGNISDLFRLSNRGNWDISHSFFKTMDLLIQMRISDLHGLVVEAINLASTSTQRRETENLSKSSASSSQHIGPKFGSKRAENEEENLSPVPLEKGAAELQQAGIEFVPSRANSFVDFNFKGGVLEIPLVTINNLFSTILINSMALETCSPYDNNKPKPLTRYIYFMSSLIKGANDVKFLCSKGIISRFSDNDKKVADLFTLLGRYAVPDVSDSQLWKTMRAIQSYNKMTRTPMSQFLMETSAVLVMFFAVTLLIICLLYLGFISRKLAQLLAVYGNTNLICVLSLQRCRWRHVLRNPVQVMVIISTFLATFPLFLG